MKVRHKLQNELQFEVIENFYVIQMRDGHLELGKKCDYEPVPQDRWQDVTGECRFQEAWDEVIHNTGTADVRLFEHKCRSNYRLRKVEVGIYFDENAGGKK